MFIVQCILYNALYCTVYTVWPKNCICHYFHSCDGGCVGRVVVVIVVGVVVVLLVVGVCGVGGGGLFVVGVAAVGTVVEVVVTVFVKV